MGAGEDLGYCPKCGAEMYVHADRCPHCGDYVTPTSGRKSRGVLWAVLVAVVLAALLILILSR